MTCMHIDAFCMYVCIYVYVYTSSNINALQSCLLSFSIPDMVYMAST